MSRPSESHFQAFVGHASPEEAAFVVRDRSYRGQHRVVRTLPNGPISTPHPHRVFKPNGIIPLSWSSASVSPSCTYIYKVLLSSTYIIELTAVRRVHCVHDTSFPLDTISNFYFSGVI